MAIAEENQIVQVVLPRTHVKDIDARAQAQRRTRSAFLQLLILECLSKKNDQVPEPEPANIAA